MSRFWIGGSGNWTDTAHWSTTSGGSGGAAVPTSADAVIFDANSFGTTGQTVTLPSGSDYYCYSLDFSAVTNSPSFSMAGLSSLSAARLIVYKDVTLNSDVSYQGPWGTLLLSATITDHLTATLTTDDAQLEFSLGINKQIGGATFGNTTVVGDISLLRNLTILSPIINQPTVTFYDDLTSTLSVDTPSATTLASVVNNKSTDPLIIQTSGTSTLNVGSLVLERGSITYVRYGHTFKVTSVSTTGSSGLAKLWTSNVSYQFNITSSASMISTDYLDLRGSNAGGTAIWYAGNNSTNSGSNTGWIFTSPVYTRSAIGTLLFGGGITSRLVTYLKSISGTLLFGGEARHVILKDTEGIEEKRYLYKVYDEEGNFVEVWPDVITEPYFTHELNEIGSEMNIELARNSDSVGVTTAPLLTEADTIITTEGDATILATTESKNQVGPGSSVVHNYRVDVWVYYGSIEPLLTEAGEPILTEDDEEILASIGAPNGRRIFTGFIAEINNKYGSTETVSVKLLSYGWDLDQYVVSDTEGDTTIDYFSQDPSEMARAVVDRFVTESSLEQVTYTYRTDTSIFSTGTTASYTFRNNTYADALQKITELMPEDWYFYIDLGTNVVHYSQKSVTPEHTFYLGKHIKELDLRSSIHDVINRTLITGGGDPPLYRNYSAVPAEFTRRRLDQYTDGRLENTDSADIIGQGQNEANNKIKYRTSIEILSKVYDIESINVGQTIGFRNFDNYIDLLTMTVVGRTYTPDSVQLQLETKPPTINKRLEDIKRNLLVTDNQNIPDAPTDV